MPAGVTARTPRTMSSNLSVSRGVLAGGPRRRVAADAGELEALREVPDRKAKRTKQFLGLRAGESRPEFGLTGYLVESVQLIQPTQVQRHDGREGATDRVEAADDAGAAAEGHDGDAPLCAVGAGSWPPRLRRRAAARRPANPGRRSPCGATGPEWTYRLLAAAGRDRRRRSIRRRRWRRAPRDRRRAVPMAAGVPRLASSSTEVGPSTPRAPLSKARIPSESGLAAAGSPHAFHFIGGRSRSVVVRHALQYYRCCQSVTMNPRRSRTEILAAAASCVHAYGVDRVTLAEIARRAGVSRPTIYRRWPDTRSILGVPAHRTDHARPRRRAVPRCRA